MSLGAWFWLSSHYPLLEDAPQPVPPSAGPVAPVRLTDDQIKEIVVRYRKGKETQSQLAAEFGVSQPVISRIVRKGWK
jgi:hypothetical protein